MSTAKSATRAAPRRKPTKKQSDASVEAAGASALPAADDTVASAAGHTPADLVNAFANPSVTDAGITSATDAQPQTQQQPQQEPGQGQGDRERAIQLAAYALAEQRGFEPGREVDDWLEAERRLDRS